jgi:hypothetical protein
VPIHDAGFEQARRCNRRLDLEGPAVGGGHCFSDRLLVYDRLVQVIWAESSCSAAAAAAAWLPGELRNERSK